MGSLSVCSSTEICGCKCHRMYDAWVLRLSSLQLKRILAVQAGDCHCMYHSWPLFSCSSTESKLSSTVKASAKLAVSVVRLSLRVHEKNQGSKNLFCASRRIFRAEPGCHFSGRIFFHLGRNHAPRLKSLGAKKKLSLRPASAHTRTQTSSMK